LYCAAPISGAYALPQTAAAQREKATPSCNVRGPRGSFPPGGTGCSPSPITPPETRMQVWRQVVTAGFDCLAPSQFENAFAQLSAVGPITPDNGFPFWYRDAANTQFDLCLTTPTLCGLLAPVQLVTPGLPFPLNFAGTFPDESFYTRVQA